MRQSVMLCHMLRTRTFEPGEGEDVGGTILSAISSIELVNLRGGDERRRQGIDGAGGEPFGQFLSRYSLQGGPNRGQDDLGQRTGNILAPNR